MIRSLDAKIVLRDSIGIARSYANIGMIYSNRQMPDSAILFYQKQVVLCDQLNEVYGKGIGLNNIGQVYMEKGQFDVALDYFQQALEIKSSLDDKNGMSVTLGNIGELHIRQGHYRQAIDPLQRAIDMATQANSLPKLEIPYRLITQAYVGVGDYKQAYHFQTLLQGVKDSLNNKDRLDRAEELEAKYQHDLQQAELAKRELTIERQDFTKNRILMAAAFLILVLGGLFYRLRSKQKIKQKEIELQAQLEHAEAEKLRELDAMKSAFLTNISHEFRTPLTLINSPLEQLIKGTLKGDLNTYYQSMLRNGRRLLDLVNQMLDLSKLEEGKLLLHVSRGDVIHFIRSIGETFEPLAEQKELTYLIQIDETESVGYFDADKLDKILVNLLSNAFKYTQEGGRIQLKVTIEGENVQVVVSDSGIGIPFDLQSRLFDRFFLTTQSDIQAGSGLGLALTKELVELHHGQIKFNSEPGVGSAFIFFIPINKSAYQSGEMGLASPGDHVDKKSIALDSKIRPAISFYKPISDRFTAVHRPKVLIVEDHQEVRAYLVEQLKSVFDILEAVDGVHGLATAEDRVPDLIISDVMMPGMSGTELCQKIKLNEQTSHIPVILLTAKAEQSDKLDGLIKGADDYLVKPFDVEELRTRAMNLIEQRARLQAHYRRSLHMFSPELEPVRGVDELFLEKVKSEIQTRIGDEQFSVVELSQQVGMSRSQLHRKLSALTGCTPNQVIRMMRLEKARHLITERMGTIAEIAYTCGFSSPAYFSKCFKDQFGHSPGEDR